ncbi:MAG TPA: hypothetical protein GXZ45_11025 [Propionibacterium sp.]|nr:hypothetical protein [Propionibacterium sp.]
MFALTIDQHRSRRGEDRVPGLLDALVDVATALPFERTVGDEVQGLLTDPAAVLEALLVALRDGHWSVGLGIGPVETPLPASVRAARGPALLDARAAVERAKTSGDVRVAVGSASDPTGAADVEAVARLIGTLVGRRTDRQWTVIDAVDAAPTQRAAADALGVSPQNVSQALAASAIAAERAGYPVLVKLLERVEAT